MMSGQTGTPPPSMADIAHLIGGASAEYMHEVGQLTGNNGLFSAIAFGNAQDLSRPKYANREDGLCGQSVIRS
jgi:hypothetical protein